MDLSAHVCLPIATPQVTESVRRSVRTSDSTSLPSFVFQLISTCAFSVMQSLDATFLTKTFCELKLEEVVFLLSCDDLSVETEDQVFDMIIHWIAIDVATRRGDTRLYDAYHVCTSGGLLSGPTFFSPTASSSTSSRPMHH